MAESGHGGKRKGAGRPARAPNASSPRKKPRLDQEELKRLTSLVSQVSPNKKGHSSSTDMNRQGIVVVLNLKLEGVAHTVAIKRAAALLGRGEKNLIHVVNTFLDYGTVIAKGSVNRGRGSATYVARPCVLTDEHVTWIKDFVGAMGDQGMTVRVPDIRSHLWNSFGLLVSPWIVRYALVSRLKMRYGKVQVVYARESPDIKLKTRNCLIEYAQALSLQAQGLAIIVYHDESYVNTGHHAQLSWFSEGFNTVKGSAGVGPRLILMHAMTRDGLLRVCDEKGNPLPIEPFATGPQLSCEQFYPAGKSVGDYHENVDAHTWITYAKNRIIPTVRKLYPGLRIFIMQDNASYHKAKSADWVSPADMIKKQLAEKLVEWKIAQVTVVRQKHGQAPMAHVFQSSQYNIRAPVGPSVDELLVEVKRYVGAHPELTRTQLDKLLIEESLVDSKEPDFHRVIYTPPYNPLFQPMEKAWGYGKAYIAKHHFKDRSMAHLRDATLRAFYGDGLRHTGITSVMCRNWINGCHKDMNKAILADGVLSGTIDNLAGMEQVPQLVINLDSDDDDDDEPDEQEVLPMMLETEEKKEAAP
jgi:hypothetical protein